MELRISIDEELLQRAHAYATAHDTSLEVLIHAYLQDLVDGRSHQSVAEELIGLMRSEGGHSGGTRCTREDAYPHRE